MLLGIFIRFVAHGIPEGINSDEAYSAYEAYSLLNFSFDSHGYHNPVYFISLGSGRNVLESYIMIPFIKLLGFNRFAVRLPQRLGAIITLYFFYLILKKVKNEKIAVLGLFLLVINPWHITMSRWALESNLVIAFLVTGIYFFLLGLEHSPWYLVSALCFGLSLYCYALVWIFVPIFLFLSIAYCIYCKIIHIDKWLVSSAILLLIMALPLILFLCINFNWISEINTHWFSIPKLSEMRTNEFALNKLLQPIRSLYNLLVTQNDGLSWSSVPGFGLYYKFSLPFIILGFVVLFQKTISAIHTKSYNVHVCFCIFLVSSLLPCLSQSEINTNRVNVLHLPIIYCCLLGIYEVFTYSKKYLSIAIILSYALSFIAFTATYFTTYAETMAAEFQSEYPKILNAALEIAEDDETPIYLTSSFEPLKVLYYTQFPTDEYVDTVYYTNEPSAWLDIGGFGRYKVGIDFDYLDSKGIYIISNEDIPLFEEADYTVERFYTFAIAHMQD